MSTADEDVLRFGVPGPLEVTRGAGSHAPTALKPRLSPAALLVRQGQVMSVGELVGAVWAERPPRTAGVRVPVTAAAGVRDRARASCGRGLPRYALSRRRPRC